MDKWLLGVYIFLNIFLDKYYIVFNYKATISIFNIYKIKPLEYE